MTYRVNFNCRRLFTVLGLFFLTAFLGSSQGSSLCPATLFSAESFIEGERGERIPVDGPWQEVLRDQQGSYYFNERPDSSGDYFRYFVPHALVFRDSTQQKNFVARSVFSEATKGTYGRRFIKAPRQGADIIRW